MDGNLLKFNSIKWKTRWKLNEEQNHTKQSQCVERITNRKWFNIAWDICMCVFVCWKNQFKKRSLRIGNCVQHARRRRCGCMRWKCVHWKWPMHDFQCNKIMITNDATASMLWSFIYGLFIIHSLLAQCGCMFFGHSSAWIWVLEAACTAYDMHVCVYSTLINRLRFFVQRFPVHELNFALHLFIWNEHYLWLNRNHFSNRWINKLHVFGESSHKNFTEKFCKQMNFRTQNIWNKWTNSNSSSVAQVNIRLKSCKL